MTTVWTEIGSIEGPQGVVSADAPATYDAASQTIGVLLGTTAHTAAAGDDARLTGATQKAANLSDLASASSARTNLGLGSAATHPVADFDAVGTAASAIVAHIAATDPHGDRAFTTAQIAALVNSAPGLLDTLGEIAAQLANDESAVGALTTLVNTKLSIATAQATYVQRTQVVVGLDTDGTPYWDSAVEYANARAVALDTDSVPYVVTG